MSNHIKTSVLGKAGFVCLDRAQSLNALSLTMIRNLTSHLVEWSNDLSINAVIIHSAHAKFFCAGGDVRFFYEAFHTDQKNNNLLRDFFTEEYTLNHLIHFYPKPYVAVMDGIVMGGGMGIAQSGPNSRIRIVTERTKMAMPEVSIGLFPDVGGGHFLSRLDGELGAYLALTGEIVGAEDALFSGLADLFLPSVELENAVHLIESVHDGRYRERIEEFASSFKNEINPDKGLLARHKADIDRHFCGDSVLDIARSLERDNTQFARRTLATMLKRSPLMMCVSLAQLRRAKEMSFADCLRMERTMIRHCFENGEVLEGIRAAIIDKDNRPRWKPASLAEVSAEMINRFFDPIWPDYAHPLRDLI